VATAVAVRAAEPPAVGATPEPPAPPAPAAPADGVRPEAPAGPDGEPLYRRSYWIPLAEVVAVAAALNFTHRNLLGSEWAHSNLSTARTNLMRWTYDTDPFGTNNIMHPYNGAIYHGAARSMGLDPWQSFGYAFLGSALWEVAGETEPASINDQIMTPFGGAFLGEVLYRSAVLALGPGHERPGFWRGLGALLLSPPAGVNRMIFGDTYRTFDFDRRPVTYFQIFAGGGVAYDRTPREQTGDQTAVTAHAGLHLAFGLPDERGFPVRHPFDHFDLAFTLAATEREAPFGALFIRGILAGARIEGRWRGLWGLTGIFDYVAPRVFRVGTAALGISATGQLGTRGAVALQGTAMLGAGFGNAGATTQPIGGRDYHSGPAAQVVLEARVLLGDTAVLGADLRQYLVAGAVETRGFEEMTYLTLSGLVRIGGPHAVGVERLAARRRAAYTDVPDIQQRSTALSISYALVTDPWFGAYQPRPEVEVE
jgi:hypothetical protein